MRQEFKEEILQEQDTRVLKETPWRVRIRKRVYQKLTACLRKKQIWYKWLIPEGLSLEFQGIFFKLNSTTKAEDFLKRNRHLWQGEEEERGGRGFRFGRHRSRQGQMGETGQIRKRKSEEGKKKEKEESSIIRRSRK